MARSVPLSVDAVKVHGPVRHAAPAATSCLGVSAGLLSLHARVSVRVCVCVHVCARGLCARGHATHLVGEVARVDDASLRSSFVHWLLLLCPCVLLTAVYVH